MRLKLLTATALTCISASAFAADLPTRAAPPPYVAVPVFTWTGFYAGVNIGGGFGVNGDRNRIVTIAPGGLPGPLGGYAGTVTLSGNNNQDGIVGGGQIGYNYQIGSFVIGLEADIQGADLAGNRAGTVIFAPPPIIPGGGIFAPAINNRAGGIEWFGTVRGRVGYAWDRLLVFGTGGFAYGDGPNINCATALGAVACGSNLNDIRTGWTAGGGVEYAFTPNWTGKIEALYVSLDRNRAGNFVGATSIGGVVTPVFVAGNRQRTADEFVVVRAGVNWKFNTF
ncbi:outer membrane protein [Enterovirga sp. CN4-39]|uniref:outer membrane protein n=1 Tax=Enterovirga sp. CN4-39 TaxID=3400910 RepID=UPI003C0B6C0A